jgi:hypothetical protein
VCALISERRRRERKRGGRKRVEDIDFLFNFYV